jgi:hypothetical protein
VFRCTCPSALENAHLHDPGDLACGTGSLGRNDPIVQGSLELTLLLMVGGWSLELSLLEPGLLIVHSIA